MFRKLQNLRHKGLSLKNYTKEFYKMNIREGHRENDEEKVVRYINGLRCEIQDDISMITIIIVEYSYQVSLKEEEKLARKQIQRNRGKIPNKGSVTYPPRQSKIFIKFSRIRIPEIPIGV